MGAQKSGRFNKAKARRSAHHERTHKYERQRRRTNENKERQARRRAKKFARLRKKQKA